MELVLLIIVIVLLVANGKRKREIADLQKKLSDQEPKLNPHKDRQELTPDMQARVDRAVAQKDPAYLYIDQPQKQKRSEEPDWSISKRERDPAYRYIPQKKD